MITYDSLDEQIIHLLQQDGRMPASEMGRLLGQNERTLRKRIERLRAGGAIRITAIANPLTFQYVTSVDILLEIGPLHEEQVVGDLLSMQEVSYLAYGQGNREFSLEARFKDNDQMHQFLRKTLPGMPGVKVIQYALVPRILRNIDEWRPRSSDFKPPNPEEETK